jgi:hypothetical protein
VLKWVLQRKRGYRLDRDRWRILVNTAIKAQLPQNIGISWEVATQEGLSPMGLVSLVKCSRNSVKRLLNVNLKALPTRNEWGLCRCWHLIWGWQERILNYRTLLHSQTLEATTSTLLLSVKIYYTGKKGRLTTTERLMPNMTRWVTFKPEPCNGAEA